MSDDTPKDLIDAGLTLNVEADRMRFTRHGPTGICVRAQGIGGKWGAYDIAELDKDSLRAWLRSRGGVNKFAENVVFILLGHKADLV
jgi:hypothetical protein